MPSWNVHIAHADRLLEKGAGCLGVDIHYPDAFLLGNVAPDVHIGFMVPDYSHKVRTLIHGHFCVLITFRQEKMHVFVSKQILMFTGARLI